MTVQTPRTLGRYAIEAEIGRGMMGVVYRASDPVLGRAVALKTVSAALAAGDLDRASFEARFLAEARAAALLSHPAIVTVHDFGRDEATDTLFIALEHLEGRTVAEIVKANGRLPWRQALAIAGRIAGGLDHAHERGIVHRDVKPANIIVLEGQGPLEPEFASGESGGVWGARWSAPQLAKLTDFGIARISAAELTAPGEFLGTPSYMSPEQASGAPLDGKSDVFSLGAVLYFMLTARRAFDAPSVPGIMTRIVHEAPAPLDVAGLPEDAAYVVARCLAKDPAARYPRAKAVEEDVEDVLAGRTPRHRAGWQPAEDTVAFVPPDAPAPPVRPRPAGGPPSTGDALVEWVDRLGWRGFAAVAGVLLLVLVAAAAMRRTDREESRLPPVLLPVSPAPARLEVAFRHPFRSATLRVFVDDALVLEERVAGRVTRDLLAVKLRQGSYTGTVDVPPGARAVRVEADDGAGFRESRRLRGDFESGRTRRLVASVEGVLGKDLEVSWGR